MLILALLFSVGDTVRVRDLPVAPAFDGIVDSAAYGAPAIEMRVEGGSVRVWLGRSAGWVYVAATLPDSTPSWRDEFALLVETIGDRTPAPGHDDAEWVIPRVLDSSEVLHGVHGRWMLPGDDPAWRLGAARGGEGWEVRSNSTEGEWSVELRIDAAWLAGTYGGTPAIGLLSYDGSVRRWEGWPRSPECPNGAQLERRPDCWAVVLPASTHSGIGIEPSELSPMPVTLPLASKTQCQTRGSSSISLNFDIRQ